MIEPLVYEHRKGMAKGQAGAPELSSVGAAHQAFARRRRRVEDTKVTSMLA